MPPQAKEVENPWWDVGPKEEAKRWAPGAEGGTGLWQKLFGEESEMPKWFEDISRFSDYLVSGAEERVKSAWEKPELRYQTRLPGGVKPEEPTEQKPGATGWLEKVKEGPVEAALGVSEAIGEGWEKAAGKSGLLRTAEKGAAAGLAILDSIGRVPKQIYGASVVSAHPESEGMPMEDWAPLASIAPSLVTRQLKSGKSVFEEGILDRDSSLGEALRRIKAGEDAYEVANELYDPWAEIVTEIATDPLNAIDFLSVGNKLRRGAAVTRSQRMMAEAVDQSPVARRILDNWQRELAEHATAEADILKTASDVLGEPGVARFWDKVKASAPARIFDLTPAAKADRDLGDFWVVSAGPMSEVKSADEALDLARKWADAPEELGQYGALVNSPTGQKARVIWKHLADTLPDLPSVKADQFNPVRFMADVTEAAKDALRKAYNYKEPNAIDKFLNAYKGIQSEFYLSGVFSPGYVLRNSASDLFTMAMDGVGTFERRTNIDDFMTRFGLGTQRAETRGAGQAAMRYGLREEPRSVLPGPLGKASKKGQEITRHAEPGGVLPLGEEPRYSRAQYKALTRFLDTNSLRSTPEIPTVFRSILGDQMAEDLRVAVSRGLNKQEKIAALNSVLDAKTPLQAFDPSRYLDPMLVDALEPELYKRLVDAARKMPATATPDDWRGLVKRISDEVEAVAEERLSKLESLPVRKIATDTEEAEILDDLTATLKDLASDPNPNISGEARRLMDQYQQITQEIARARDEAMNAAAQTQHPDAMRVLYAAMTRAEEMRTEARAGLDGLMRETVNAYRQRKAGAADWARYFFAKAQGELELAGQRAQVFGEAQEQLRRLRNGEDVSAVLGKSGYDLSVEAMQRAAKVNVPEMPKGFAPGSVRNATEDAQFQQMLKAARGQTQAKEAEAWRIAFALEPGSYGEALDLLKSADGDVAMAGKRAAGRVREARQRYFDKAKGAKTRAEFDKLFSGFYAERNKIWNDLRTETIERWDQVQRDLMMRNWNPASPPDLIMSTRSLPGDAELLQGALRTNPVNWTDEMKAALERWLGEARPPEVKPEKPHDWGTESIASVRSSLGIPKAEWEKTLGAGVMPKVKTEKLDEVPVLSVPEKPKPVTRQRLSRSEKVGEKPYRQLISDLGDIERKWEGKVAPLYEKWDKLDQWPLDFKTPAGYRNAMAERVIRAYDEGVIDLTELERFLEDAGAFDLGPNAATEDILAYYHGKGRSPKRPPEEQAPLTRAEIDDLVYRGIEPESELPPTKKQTRPPKSEPKPEKARRAVATPEEPSLSGIKPDTEADLRRALYNQMIAKAGVGEPPHLADLIAAQSDATRKALSQIEDGVLRDWETWRPVIVDEATRKGLAQWLDAEVMPRWHETRATALQYARTQADDALLDYNNRRNFDTWIARVVPYHYWFTRSGYNWSRRIATNPALLTHYVRVRDAQRIANEQAGRRQRFGASFEVPFPWLPDWMGDSLYVDPMTMVLPYANFMRMNWDDADEASQGMRAIRDQMDKIGFRPYHFLDLPYQNGWLAKLGEWLGMDADKARQTLSPDVQGGFSYILPQTQIIKSLTAGKGDWGPQGLNIEGMLRRAAGLPKGDVWDPYRVSRMLANLAAESPKDAELARTALMAQELLSRDPEQKEKLWEAGNPIALAAQEQYGWTDEEVKAAQELLSLAMVRAQQERGMGMLGWMLGPRVSIEPKGERAQMELAEEARGKIWTGGETGSREAYQQYKMDNPALYPRSQQYEIIPGESDWEGMASGARANWLALTKEKQEVIERYQTLIDKHLRANPHDWDGRNALMDKRKEELDALKTRYPLPPIEEDLPPVLYGMNPREMWDSVVEDVGYELQEQEPSPDAFKDAKGAIDWGRYYDARDEWLASLPKTLPGVGPVLGGSYAGMTTAEAYEAFERRYHTPLEAANRVYQEAIAGAAWDQYNALKAQEEAQWPGMKALQDQYYSWPKGSQERREFLDAHPELKTYWDRKRMDPYDSTVGAVGEMAAQELIPVILATYKGRGWTEAELKKALKGVVFPPLAAQSKKSTSKSSAKSAASDAGIPYWSDYTPGLENEDWRSVVGKPWWEKYPKKSYSSKKTSYAKKRYGSSYSDDDWDDWDEDNGGGWRTYQEAPKWQYRRTIYGGPQWG